MVPWVQMEKAEIPGSGDELGLFQRGEEFSIRVGNQELMNSRLHSSEESLGSMIGERLGERASPRVLIGGLGMGFTLAACLRWLGPAARVTMAELIPAVVRWNRGVLGELACHPLADPRVEVLERDVAQIIRQRRASFDAILLDVDNGPVGLTQKGNNWLYCRAGLQAAWAALNPDGIWAVWSAQPDEAFSRCLGDVGFSVEQVSAPARQGGKGAKHTIWIGRRGR